MINIIIYLKKEFCAEDLAKFLLVEKLIAAASIDENNISYKIENGNLKKEMYSVITAKSKSLLLPEIISTIEKKIGSEVLITSTPIVGSNIFFNNLITENTLKT